MYSKILVPIDGSPTAALGLTEAIKLAKSQGATLRLMHIVHEWIVTSTDDTGLGTAQMINALRANGKAVLNDAEARVRSAGVEVETICEEAIGSGVGPHIVEHAKSWPADLIVMGTHGRRGIQHMVMGSDAECVVRYAQVPVLLVRGPASPKE